jgi:hypothetical protein
MHNNLKSIFKMKIRCIKSCEGVSVALHQPS